MGKFNKTLGYARLYDNTVAADYYRAIDEIEDQNDELNHLAGQPSSREILVLVSQLASGSHSEDQEIALVKLKETIMALEHFINQSG